MHFYSNVANAISDQHPNTKYKIYINITIFFFQSFFTLSADFFPLRPFHCQLFLLSLFKCNETASSCPVLEVMLFNPYFSSR